MNGGSASKEAKQARRAEDERQSEIRSGTNKTNYIFDKQFDPAFFAKQSKAYTDYATPQLEDQYKDTGEALTYDLARRGLTDSSVRGEKTADLTKLYTLSKQDITGKAREFSTDAKNRVEDARADVIGQLQATGDAKGAASSALARADALSKPPAYSPLENLFVDFTDALGTQAGLERAYAAGSPMRPRYNLGLYDNNRSVRVS
jgi:hypothetical protein